MSARAPRLWAIVPAAGSGARLAGAAPKQYQQIGNVSLLEHTLNVLLQVEAIDGIVVALAANDTYWPGLQVAGEARIETVNGGERRCDSVLAGLRSLAASAQADDLIMVHDAARPCITSTDIERLLAQTGEHSVGGILAIPVVDTLKQVTADGSITGTEDRSQLYQAQTPQLFRFAVLLDALQGALADEVDITDESSAVEHMGMQPIVVEGSRYNIKVTYTADLALAESILRLRGVID
ncbi:MAG: 2-C-methyl-D-erythritol 4-phosphate cytidylyltransferase [Pseudomonadales bacterium]